MAPIQNHWRHKIYVRGVDANLAPELLYKAQIFPTFSQAFYYQWSNTILCDQLEIPDSSNMCHKTESLNAGPVSQHKLEESVALSFRRG